MKVTLINHTPNPDETVAAAARLCYSPLGAAEIREKFLPGEAESFLNNLVEMGHLSPVEHVSFTFAIEGVSRVLSHQLVRHRIGVSYSQKSQRYVRENQFEYIIPPSILKNPEAEKIFRDKMGEIQLAYNELAKLVPPEDARYVLPNATETKLVVTYNARSLYHFFQLRCCKRAQWEIRHLAELMLEEVKKVAPSLFSKAGPTCVSQGICFEGKMSCGRVASIRSRS
ncbi:FAD-dependent thymidylate synthase [Candidatus Formimonas warabiya]|uniref:Flavin-dependent thymidylate synthase n=1 Tax=Formimonas warabiya TaxID=1761012 RepID=A0A3G1KXH0_FORW1|nr:FAD-dependent thymidylate synthase [Candidatus Formimonas warabiya]ATW27097.1 FAD-dependent thymidylate synthase [Candidatus Formimonas warabiya]